MTDITKSEILDFVWPNFLSLMVHFRDSTGGFRPVAPLRPPEHETAFATTVHKAQESEFDRVLLMLPAMPNRVFTRELLYTGVTRPRSGVAIVGAAEVVEKAIVSPTRRYSRLVARLAEMRGRIRQELARSDMARPGIVCKPVARCIAVPGLVAVPVHTPT